nr:hypothetical protein [Tanacetum cinerariifolium]
MVVLLSFTVNLYHDGLFQVTLLEYANFDSKVINDVSFDASYKNNLKIDLFTKHSGYEIIKMIDEELHLKKPVGHVDSDSDVETKQPLDDVAHVVEQFEHENEGNVNIRMTIDDPWLNRLVGNDTFIGQTDNPNPNLQGRFLLEVEDPDDEQVESKFKAKQDVSYPSFNHETPWNQCKPVLGMRFESPQQLKHMLANYGAQNGYQLRYMQNDHNKLLAFCGRDVSEGSTCELETEVNDEDEKLYFKRCCCNINGVGFSAKIEEIKMLDAKAHEWLVKRNPNSWCMTYFEMDRCSVAFDNGISKSFNLMIVRAKGKPIITMLEDIRVYIMQMMFCMNKQAFDNKYSITPSVRRQMEYNKRIQRRWLVFLSVYKEVEVRMGDQSFGVNLHQMKCVCNMWQLSGIPCVHAMAGYMHIKMNPDLGEVSSSSMPPPNASPSTSNTMSLPLTPSTSITMPPPLTPSPSTLNTMPLTSGRPAKSSAFSSRGGSRSGATSRGGSKGGASKRGRGSSKKSRGSNTIPFQGLRDEASDEEHQFKMDKKVVYEMEREQMAIDEDDYMPPPTATPSSSNIMPPPPTSSSSNTMPPPLHHLLQTLCHHLVQTLVPAKSSASSRKEVVLWVVQPAEVVIGVVKAKEVEVQAKEVEVLTLCHGKVKGINHHMREFDQVEEHKAQDKGMPEDVSAGKQPIIKD